MSLATLLFGACTAPIFWLGQLMLGYAVSRPSPATRRPSPSLAASGPLRATLLAFDTVAIAAAAAGGVVAFGAYGKFVMKRRQNEAAMEIGEGRSRFMALWGVMSSMGFFCAILFGAIASISVPLCAI